MNNIVISAINLIDGGAFTILQQCLGYVATSKLIEKYKFIVLVNNRSVVCHDKFIVLEFPKAKRHWVNRIYYEYYYFRKIAKSYRPYLWLSLHDMTPTLSNVERIATYMHNPSPFSQISLKELKYYGYSYILFALFYKYLYRINIHKNTYCIVQQQWLRAAFAKMYKINPGKIIVSRPIVNKGSDNKLRSQRNNAKFTFFFPSFPRPFKAFEVVCSAVELLEQKGLTNFCVKLTIDGSETKYSKWILERYGYLRSIEFVGLLDKNEMERAYYNTDCLIFPSRLETWGLPISEFKPYNKPMILVDKPYAHETASGANKVAFFKTDSAAGLSLLMHKVLIEDFSDFQKVPEMQFQDPSSTGWAELFDILLNDR